jgi:hypothetical protein
MNPDAGRKWKRGTGVAMLHENPCEAKASTVLRGQTKPPRILQHEAIPLSNVDCLPSFPFPMRLSVQKWLKVVDLLNRSPSQTQDSHT